MKRYAEAQELAPRDVVARAIVSEMHRTSSQHVYLDMTAKSAEFLQKRFPRIYATCLSYGLDLVTDVAPVCPAAHYMMGGVKTDLSGRTTIPGLYAAGETADTGVHGANRLASNSLLEGLVFGARAGDAMAKEFPGAKQKKNALPGSPAPRPDAHHTNSNSRAAGSAGTAPSTSKGANSSSTDPVAGAVGQIRDLMWRQVGILRSGKELSATVATLEQMELPRSARTVLSAEAGLGHTVVATKTEHATRADHELANLHTLATLVTRSALAREESRGSHYRSDFPYRDDDDFQKHSRIQHGKDVTFES